MKRGSGVGREGVKGEKKKINNEGKEEEVKRVRRGEGIKEEDRCSEKDDGGWEIKEEKGKE